MSYIRSLQELRHGGTQYVAVGGVNQDNIGDFFKAEVFIGVGIGSNLIPGELVKRDAPGGSGGLCGKGFVSGSQRQKENRKG